MILTITTCARALNNAALNRKSAFQMELAVGLAVFLSYGSTDKEAREMLTNIYATAGYECTRVTGMDYKTVNRRINATSKLFEKLHKSVTAWAGKHGEDRLLAALCLGLEPYEFMSVQDVLRYCSPDRALPKRQTVLSVKPNADAISAPTTGQQVIRDMFRRASDHVPEGSRRVEVGPLSVVIPPEATKDDLMELARTLLEMAKDLLTT